MPPKTLTNTTSSPYLNSALDAFEELTYFHSQAQIIQDVIALYVQQATEPFYPHLSPLDKYPPEETEMFLDLFTLLQTEIETQIKTIETTKKMYDLPELHLTYTYPDSTLKERHTIRSSQDAFYYLVHNWSEQIEFVEEFNILLLNTANQVLGIYNVSKGGRRATFVDHQVLFAAALKANASSIVLAHNHPSGKLRPSQADLQCTEALQKSAKILGVSIVDHLIVSRKGYFSFADEGLLEVATAVQGDAMAAVDGALGDGELPF